MCLQSALRRERVAVGCQSPLKEERKASVVVRMLVSREDMVVSSGSDLLAATVDLLVIVGLVVGKNLR